MNRPGLAALALALAASTLNAGAPAAAEPTPTVASSGPADCLWFGPTFTADDSELNYAFPDTGATYWAAQFTVPEGARLELVGEFAHARYQSLNAYDLSTNAPVDALNDVSTIPDQGSRNPFLPGARRAGDTKRDYTVRVSTDIAPAEGAQAPNTLYAGAPEQESQLLLYRLYLPDRNRDITGGAGLPQPRLTLADGATVTGQAACDALQVVHETPQVDTLPAATYNVLRNQPGKPATFPAEEDPHWLAYYNTQFGIGCYYFGVCAGNPPRVNGQYANDDANYVMTMISRGYGPVLTLQGKLPATPRTLDRVPFMGGDVDMRYWSLCSNESMFTTRVEDCVYDEQVPTDEDGDYTIVVSRTEDRPANAVEECGVAWIAWPERGDGAGHLDDGFLILRNMLPAARFTHAVQNTVTPGDERDVMGEYLPTSAYSSVAEFESRGCTN